MGNDRSMGASSLVLIAVAGGVGRTVLEKLRAQDVPVRAMVHHDDDRAAPVGQGQDREGEAMVAQRDSNPRFALERAIAPPVTYCCDQLLPAARSTLCAALTRGHPRFYPTAQNRARSRRRLTQVHAPRSRYGGSGRDSSAVATVGLRAYGRGSARSSSRVGSSL
jgi:hypothetical protein